MLEEETLRFKQGDKVCCCVDAGHTNQRVITWKAGVVEAVLCQEQDWPENMMAAYVVKLQNGQKVAIQRDDHTLLRAFLLQEPSNCATLSRPRVMKRQRDTCDGWEVIDQQTLKKRICDGEPQADAAVRGQLQVARLATSAPRISFRDGNSQLCTTSTGCVPVSK